MNRGEEPLMRRDGDERRQPGKLQEQRCCDGRQCGMCLQTTRVRGARRVRAATSGGDGGKRRTPVCAGCCHGTKGACGRCAFGGQQQTPKQDMGSVVEAHRQPAESKMHAKQASSLKKYSCSAVQCVRQATPLKEGGQGELEEGFLDEDNHEEHVYVVTDDGINESMQRTTAGDNIARLLDRRIADDETVERARGCLGGRVVAHHAPGASRASLDVGDLVGGLCSGGIGFPRPWRQRGCSCELPPRSLV
jgi:hypothetical protein